MTAQPPQSIIRYENGQPGCLISALWFIFIGSWLSLIWISIAWILVILIITMPIGLAMINRVPLIATLRSPTHDMIITTDAYGTRVINTSQHQHPFILRAIYFVFIGWWFSGIWMGVAWLATASIIFIPLGFWMFNRVPAVTTLARY